MKASHRLKQINLAFVIIFVISIIGAILAGNLGLAVLLQIIAALVTAIFILVKSKRRNLRLGSLAIGILISIALLYGLSIAGFYTKSSVVGEFDGGGTWVADHSVGTAALDSLDTSSFVAALFGYDCNGVYGPNCSGAPYFIGFGISEATLIAGVLVGDTLVNKHLKT